MSQVRVLQTSLMGRKGGSFPAENQDRVLHRRFKQPGRELTLLAVADGVTCCPRGGGIASYLVDQHLGDDKIFSSSTLKPVTQLGRYLRELHAHFYKEFADEPEMLESACTFSAALVAGDRVHAVSVGDSPIYLAKKKGESFVVEQLSTPDVCGRLLIDCFGAHAPFRLKPRSAAFRVDDAVVVASDGAVRSAEQLEAQLNEHGVTPAFLRAIEERARSAEYYDDASIVIAQRVK